MDRLRYYVVEGSALPEVFLRVCDAKQYLQAGKAKTVNEAAEMAGISRSAFYKYKDAVKPYYEMATERMMTFHCMLKDEPGVLSGVLGLFARNGANILTINQSIPINGQAAVTISAETAQMKVKLEAFLAKAMQIKGVLWFEPLAGE